MRAVRPSMVAGLLAALAAAPLTPSAGHGQGRARDHGDRARLPSYAVELAAGGAAFGRFQEESLAPVIFGIDDIAGGGMQRELRASGGFTFGGTLTVRPWWKTSVRAGLSFVPTEFSYRDDSGGGFDFLDQDDLGDLDVLTLDLALSRDLLDPDGQLVPYALIGVAATRWAPGDDAGPLEKGPLASEGQQPRWRPGAFGGAGLRLSLGSAMSLRVEAATYGMGNPFDGSDALYTSDNGFVTTLDEPSVTRVSRLSAGLVVAFGG